MRSACFVAAFALIALAAPASAQDWSEGGFFVGVDTGIAFRSGTTRTTDGGAGGAGIGSGVRFSEAFAIGGQLGYRLSPEWSAYLSYDHVSGDVSWRADFPDGSASEFNGKAASNIFLGNVAYSHAFAEATRLTLGLGAGVAVNSLNKVAEIEPGVGPYAWVDAHTAVSPSARISIGVEHQLSSQVSIGLGASISYIGNFATGNVRDFGGPGGREAINPYTISDVWGAAVTASLKASF